jgi:uncharacterized phage protein (TIGR02218 family)
MTFDAQETSIQSGQPVELYVFTAGVRVFYYTSAPDDLTYETKVYEALQIERSAIEDVGEISKAGMTVTSQRDIGVSDLFRIAPPSEVVTLHVYRLHLSDGALEKSLFWVGRVLSVEWQAESKCVFSCESVLSSLRRPGLRRLYQRQCPHVLYGAACGLVNTTYRTTIVLDDPFSEVTGITVKDPAIDALADNYFAGGYLEFEAAPGQIERRGIRTHVADAITLTHPIQGLAVTATIYLYAGCDHTLATCAAKFGNTVNYGGFPFIPKVNPFGGSNVF